MSDSNTERPRIKNSEPEEYLWFLFKIALNIMDPFKIIRNYFLKPIFALGLLAYEKLREKSEEKWTNTQNLVIKIFGAFVVCIIVICAAIMMYAVFYFSYMPALTYVRPLHMQYK
jgi:seipin